MIDHPFLLKDKESILDMVKRCMEESKNYPKVVARSFFENKGRPYQLDYYDNGMLLIESMSTLTLDIEGSYDNIALCRISQSMRKIFSKLSTKVTISHKSQMPESASPCERGLRTQAEFLGLQLWKRSEKH